jgi:hypothetical protein
MDAAEQEATRAKELTRLNASEKGFCSQFVSTRNVLMQALPLYADGATASRRRTIDEAISRIGLQADKVHDAYQRLIEFDNNERHHVTFKTRQDNTATEHNDICAHTDEVLGEADGPQQKQPGQVQGDIVAATVAAMNAANCGNKGPKKIDYHLKPKILGKDFTTSELRTWCSRMVFFWAAQATETRDVEIRCANFYDCMHSTHNYYFKPRMPRGIGICSPRNVGDANADHRTTLEIVQRDHETKWPIHTRRINLFKQEQKEDQSFDQWHIHLYNLGKDAKVDELTGRDWLLFLLIQSCKSNELRKKILNMPDNEITMENVLAPARKYESTEVACKEKDTINNIFMQSRRREERQRRHSPCSSRMQRSPQQTQTQREIKPSQKGLATAAGRSPPTSTGRTARRRRIPAQTAKRRATAQSSATMENV